jgi:hypothetical protein
MKNIFFQTYPSTSLKNALKRDITFSIFLTLFLFTFRPFGLHVYGLDRSYVFIGYGTVALVTTLINDYLIYSFFSPYFEENKFKVYHQILWALWHIICLGATNFIYAIYLEAFPLNQLSFFKIQLYVILSAFIPVTLYILLKQNYLLKRNLIEAQEIKKELDHSSKTANKKTDVQLPEEPTIFYSENLKETLHVASSELLYLISQDNYVEFVWIENSKTHKRLLRNTLSFYEEQLKEDSRFFRSHRAYIVNLTKIVSISGNSQGYLITLNSTEGPIPVSRNKGKLLKEALKNEVLDIQPQV